MATSPETERKLRMLRLLVDKVDGVLDEIENDTERSEPDQTGPRPPKWPRRPRFRDPKWKKLASRGVGAISFGPRGVRETRVSIDGAAPFPLPPGLADLLNDLVNAPGPSDDGLAPFVALDDLAVRRGCTPHGVTAAIGRLRERLLQDGRISPLLVETGKKSVRIRLRKVLRGPLRSLTPSGRSRDLDHSLLQPVPPVVESGWPSGGRSRAKTRLNSRQIERSS
jgi:hypothetical protein